MRPYNGADVHAFIGCVWEGRLSKGLLFLAEDEQRRRDAMVERFQTLEHFVRSWHYGPGAYEHFKTQMRLQKRRCAICGKRLKKPNQDHNHITMQLRGALCHGCNSGVGHLEKKGWLRGALSYLNRWGASMQYSKTGEQLTERFESCRLVGYADIEGVPTVGYGHTGKGVSIGMTISRQQAEQWLMEDTQHAVDTANRAVTISLTQSEFDAICDFIYNCGAAAFEDSTLLKDLNVGNYAAAANEFDKWDRAGGRVVAGILRRREAEKQEFTGAV